MPVLNLGGLEVSDRMLDLIEKHEGLGTYELMDELEAVAQTKLNELYDHAYDLEMAEKERNEAKNGSN